MKRIAWLCCVLLLAPMAFAGAAPAASAPAGAPVPAQIVDASSAGGEPPACLSAPQPAPACYICGPADIERCTDYCQWRGYEFGECLGCSNDCFCYDM